MSLRTTAVASVIWSQNAAFLLKWHTQTTRPIQEDFQWNLLHHVDWTKITPVSWLLQLEWMYQAAQYLCEITFPRTTVNQNDCSWMNVYCSPTSWQSLKSSRASCGPPPLGTNCWREQSVYRAIINNRLSAVRWSPWRGDLPWEGRTMAERGKTVSQSGCLLPCRGQTPWFSTHARWHRRRKTWCNDLRQSFETFQAVRFMSM